MSFTRPLQAALVAAVALGGCAESAAPIDVGSGGVVQPTTGGVIFTGGSIATGGVIITGGAVATGGVTSTAGDLPCDVAQVLSTHCSKCHGESTNWGGPMSLTELSDFEGMGKLTTASTVHDLVKARIHDTARPMPPASEAAMPAADRDTLTAWLDAGRPAGSCDSNPATGGIVAATGGVEGGTGGSEWVDGETSWPGGVAPEETCYQFLKHGGKTPDDTTPHMTPVGEKYINFYYTVPWTEPVVATRWRTIYDNTAVLHHWLLYKAAGARPDGGWEEQLGTHPGAQLMAGWAVGGGDETFPTGVGLRMPPPGASFELEWHLYNTAPTPVPDRSGIEICVVPEAKTNPKFVAGMTWLGTEDLAVPPNQESKRGGICTPSFNGSDTIHIVKWLPHMHLLGTHMDTWVLRQDGTQEKVFDKPFTFDQQISYDQNPPVVVNKGDKLFAECTFNNNTGGMVVFGQPTTQEMCYQFAVAFPAGALDAGSASWTGSDNTCISLNATLP